MQLNKDSAVVIVIYNNEYNNKKKGDKMTKILYSIKDSKIRKSIFKKIDDKSPSEWNDIQFTKQEIFAIKHCVNTIEEIIKIAPNNDKLARILQYHLFK
tara:strand:+ start:322 stop:618 length:297 start_codon:yes stop_codon:yes gene_type:complete